MICIRIYLGILLGNFPMNHQKMVRWLISAWVLLRSLWRILAIISKCSIWKQYWLFHRIWRIMILQLLRILLHFRLLFGGLLGWRLWFLLWFDPWKFVSILDLGSLFPPLFYFILIQHHQLLELAESLLTIVLLEKDDFAEVFARHLMIYGNWLIMGRILPILV